MPTDNTSNPPVVRVVIVAPAPLNDSRSGGIASFISGFVRHMPGDFEVEVLGAAVGDDHFGAQWREIELGGRKVLFLPVARMADSRRTGVVPAKLRIVGGTLLHRRSIHTDGRVLQVHAPAMELGLAGRGVPLVRVVHNAPEDLARTAGESTWSRAGTVLRAVERFTYRSADAVYFVSRQAYDTYVRGDARPERLHYLPNGVDTSVFHPISGSERNAAREKIARDLGLDASRNWLLSVGRIDEQKDPLLLIDAFAQYLRRGAPSPAQLVIVGDGRLRSRAQESATANGIAADAMFVGALPRERVADVMAVSDALALSSSFEASPFVIVEALASGLPVAATAVGEIPKVIADGETGSIARERTPAALADAISWVLGQSRDEISLRCVRAAAPYELRTLLEPFYAEHRRLASRRGG